MSSSFQNTATPAAKVCPDCKILKSSAEFSANAARPDGLQFYCKACYSTRSSRAYRERQRRKGKTVRERIAAPAGFKRCPGCLEIKPHSEWHRNARTYDGLASRCKSCRRVESRAAHLKRTFGLTVDDWERVIVAQGGGCAICRVGQPKHVDHDHRTGAVRGILCSACNMGLGQFADDPRRLEAAAGYLDSHEVKALGLVLQEFPPDRCRVVEVVAWTHGTAA